MGSPTYPPYSDLIIVEEMGKRLNDLNSLVGLRTHIQFFNVESGHLRRLA